MIAASAILYLAADPGSRDNHAQERKVGTCRRFAGETKEAAKYFELPTGRDVQQIPVKWESRHHRASAVVKGRRVGHKKVQRLRSLVESFKILTKS